MSILAHEIIEKLKQYPDDEVVFSFDQHPDEINGSFERFFEIEGYYREDGKLTICGLEIE